MSMSMWMPIGVIVAVLAWAFADDRWGGGFWAATATATTEARRGTFGP